MKNSTSIIIGIVAAATAGVVLGLLFNTKKGKELRQNLMDTAEGWAKKTGNLLTDGKEEFKSARSTFSDGVGDFKHEGKGVKV